MNVIELWAKEYQQIGIPSSFKIEASHAVTWFNEFLKSKSQIQNRLLDLGCGRGRNAFYMATQGFEVSCLDFVEENIDYIRNKAQEIALAVTPLCQSTTDPLPYADNTFDAVIDIFSYKHHIDPQKRHMYRQELYRVLKKEGFYLISLASYQDGFYGALREDPKQTHVSVIDPYNQIPSVLFSLEDLIREFSSHFHLVQSNEKYSTSEMHGKPYQRVILEAIFAKNSK